MASKNLPSPHECDEACHSSGKASERTQEQEGNVPSQCDKLTKAASSASHQSATAEAMPEGAGGVCMQESRNPTESFPKEQLGILTNTPTCKSTEESETATPSPPSPADCSSQPTLQLPDKGRREAITGLIEKARRHVEETGARYLALQRKAEQTEQTEQAEQIEQEVLVAKADFEHAKEFLAHTDKMMVMYWAKWAFDISKLK